LKRLQESNSISIIKSRAMKVIDLVRLFRKHLILLLLTPVLLASLVIFLTRKPDFKFASETKLYTGIATGSGVELDKTLSYFATNTAFDNLINIIKSRETQQEVAIRLLAQHLLLDGYDPKYISSKSYSELKRITPAYIYTLAGKNNPVSDQRSAVADLLDSDTLKLKGSFSFNDLKSLTNSITLPSSIDPDAYELTVKKLTDLMAGSDTNFVYRLLNFEHPHYSIKALSSVNVQRIGNSDLIQLKYETDDPGICRQTLALLIEACIKNFKNVKENRSDAVVKYFEFQLKQAGVRLKIAEDKLLEFNKVNNIINYYEQSKAVANVKEGLDVDYNNRRIKLAGIKAAIIRLEEKLGNQQQIQLKSSSIIEKRNQLGDVNYKIAYYEMIQNADIDKDQRLVELKASAEKLKEEIRLAVGDLYSLGNTAEGLPLSTILTDWINNVIEAENLKAEIEILGERIQEFQKQYSIYAPAGANLKRIEREISVSEQEYLEILHGLNLAKLKQQDNELSSNLKIVDQPYFPLSPIPTKRKMLVMMAAFIGFVTVLMSILVLEYFDDTLRNLKKASGILKIPSAGIMPKILLKANVNNMPFIINRLLDIAIQNLEMSQNKSREGKTTKTILIFSTLTKEGKTVLAGNLAHKFKMHGERVLVLNFSPESLLKTQNEQKGFSELPQDTLMNGEAPKKHRQSFLRLLLGYSDNRIDTESPFLEQPDRYLKREEYLHYNVDEKFFSVRNYEELLGINGYKLAFIPDLVLIELPPILNNAYPVELIANADLPLLVCRSNRVWTSADQGAIDTFARLTEHKIHFILNGVELIEIESVLGELPKNRSIIRKIVKKIFRFEFFSKNQI
jgi:polysaccharide biosynthesis transport protein